MLTANPARNGALINAELSGGLVLRTEIGDEVFINSAHDIPPYGNTHTVAHEHTHLQGYGNAPDTHLMELKDRIKRARAHANLTQAELAVKVGMDQTSISNLERGKSQGSNFIAQIASVCGVSAIWLAQEKGPMTHSGYQADLERIADEVEKEIGLKAIAGQDIKNHQAAKSAERLAKSLAAIASPRSRRALEKIIAAADSGHLLEDDLLLLEKVADHISKRPHPTKEGQSSRISGKIRNATKAAD